MKKQVLFTILMLLPMVAMADDSGTCGDNLTWTYTEATKTLTISGTGEMWSFNSSGGPWRKSYYSSIVKAIINDGVTSIGNHAFYGCTTMISVDIPNSVTNIGDRAFRSCTNLASIIFPNTLMSIGQGAFDNTAWYDNLPDGIVYAGKVVYKYKGNCPSNIIITDGTIGIADCAFSGSTNLSSITIPTSVEYIGISAFSSTAWENNLPDGLNYAGSVAYKYNGDMPENTSITLKEGTTQIAASAFYGCSGLTSINIPNSVTNIGINAFSGCTGLTSIEIPNSVTSIGGYAFSGCI